MVGKGSPWLTFENTVSNILQEDHLKSAKTPPRILLKNQIFFVISNEIDVDIKKNKSYPTYTYPDVSSLST